MKQQAEADEKLMTVETLAKMGFDLKDIVAEVERLELPYSTGYIQRMIDKYKAEPAQEGEVQLWYNTEVRIPALNAEWAALFLSPLFPLSLPMAFADFPEGYQGHNACSYPPIAGLSDVGPICPVSFSLVFVSLNFWVLRPLCSSVCCQTHAAILFQATRAILTNFAVDTCRDAHEFCSDDKQRRPIERGNATTTTDLSSFNGFRP